MPAYYTSNPPGYYLAGTWDAPTAEERAALDRAWQEQRAEELRRFEQREEERRASGTRTCRVCGTAFYLADGMFTERGRTCQSCRRRRASMRARRREMSQRGRRFGIELEVTLERDSYYGGEPLDPDTVVDAISDEGVPIINVGYSHTVHPDNWKIVSDSSLECGWELVSPPLYWDQRDQVRRVCAGLIALEAEATHDCGLHVHHEVTDLNATQFKRLVQRWHDASPATERLVSPDRAHSEWCAPFTSYEVERFANARNMSDISLLCADMDRYRSLNTSCYGTYGTVEVRQHESTLDADEILGWIAYTQAFVNAAASNSPAPSESLRDLIDTLPIPCDQARSLLKRKMSQRVYAYQGD